RIADDVDDVAWLSVGRASLDGHRPALIFDIECLRRHRGHDTAHARARAARFLAGELHDLADRTLTYLAGARRRHLDHFELVDRMQQQLIAAKLLFSREYAHEHASDANARIDETSERLSIADPRDSDRDQTELGRDIENQVVVELRSNAADSSCQLHPRAV